MTQRKPERLNSYISTKEIKRKNKKFTSLELSGPENSYIRVPSTCNKLLQYCKTMKNTDNERMYSIHYL